MPDRSYSLAEGALDIYRMRFPATITPLLEKLICTEARRLGFSIVFFQSAHEGRADRPDPRADWRGVDAFIVNFGAYSHTSIALHDALKASGLPAVEASHSQSPC